MGKPKQKATKANDIFATGLVFFVFLTKGNHPFSKRIDSIKIPVNILQNKRINNMTVTYINNEIKL